MKKVKSDFGVEYQLFENPSMELFGVTFIKLPEEENQNYVMNLHGKSWDFWMLLVSIEEKLFGTNVFIHPREYHLYIRAAYDIKIYCGSSEFRNHDKNFILPKGN